MAPDTDGCTSESKMMPIKIPRLHSFSDPGHGWLRVPKDLIAVLGIAAKISSFSFVHGKFVYLEEDCDCYQFIDAVRNRVDPTWDPDRCIHHTVACGESRIRRYERYDPSCVRDMSLPGHVSQETTNGRQV